MKVALIVPKGSKYGKNPYLKTFLEQSDLVSRFYGSWETPNLSLLTIAGLFPPDADLRFIDEDHGEEIPFEERFDFIMLTGMTQQIRRAYEICIAFHERGVYTVVGGIHAAIYPWEALEYADTVMVGEGEELVPQFLHDFYHGEPKKIYRSNHFCQLERSPTPRYDLVNPRLYSSYSIQTTRGCPHTCSYCTLPVMYGSVYRHKTVGQVINEIHQIKKVQGSPFVFFADDNMFIDGSYSVNLLAEIQKENIVWGTQTDISIAKKPNILKLLKQAGCRWLFIGFENISQQSLETLDRKRWKANLAREYSQMIDAIHGAGINIWGSFMFGTDCDTVDTFSDVCDFTIQNGLYSGSFTILTPLPGTELFQTMQREKRILDYDWSRYTFWDVVYQPLRMTEQELAQGVAFVYDKFYSPEGVNKRMSLIKKNVLRSERRAE